MSTTIRAPTETMTAYFDAWRRGDGDGLRDVLADDVSFAGPMATLTGAEACVEGLLGLARITTDVVVEHMWADGGDVITWFALHTSEADPIPVVNWSRVEDGRAVRIRVTFDPRPLLG
jgi:ketosteroid isomerase-like protein